MTTFEIVEARLHHCGQLARSLRREHSEAIGMTVHQHLRALFESSTIRKTWMVDGRPAAMGGLDSPMMSDEGYLWLAVAGWAARRHRIAFVKEASRQLKAIRDKRLYVLIALEDRASFLFAKRLGFAIREDLTPPRFEMAWMELSPAVVVLERAA